VRRSGVAQGPPLAVRKLSATFPVSFTLSDADSMGTGARLSEGGRVTVSARISRDGSANPRPGDPVGHLDDVAPGARDLQLVINASTP
jgi:hypothetical protein